MDFGGVGSFVFESFARNGVENMILCDKDTVDVTNLNRQLVAEIGNIGRKKAEVAKELVHRVNSNVKVYDICKEIRDYSDLEEIFENTFYPDYIIDAVDDINAKIMIIRYATEKGIKIITGAKITEIENSTVIYSIGEKEAKLESDIILLATGRRPNTDNLCVQNAGISLNERGGIKTDDHLRTDAENIWAAGDVCGKLQFTYISLDDSRIILDDMNGNRVRTINNRGAFSYSVFIQPTFSRVGMNEKEAIMNNIEYRVVKLPVMAIPKAKVIRKTEGMLKALIKEDGTILGAELFCEESHEMINFMKLAIDNGIKADVIKNFIFTHPTMSESLNDLFSM